MSHEEKTLLFVGGLHRSGTTLLARMLAEHPGVSGLSATGVREDEGQFLQDVYPSDNEYGGPGRFAFDRNSHLTEASEFFSLDAQSRLYHQWAPYWDLTKRTLLEKTPGNITKARFLQAIFPNSCFLFIVRHPVATSLATQKWSGTGIYSLIHHWLTAHEQMREDLPYLKRALVVTYEGLLRERHAVQGEIEQHIGLARHDYKLGFNERPNEKYFALWQSHFLKSGVRSQSIPRSVAEQARLANRPGERMKLFIKRRMQPILAAQSKVIVNNHREALDAVAMFEDAVQEFGYSLQDLQRYRLYPFANQD